MPMWIHRPTADFFIVFCDFSFMLEYVTCTYVSPFSSLSLPYIDPPFPPPFVFPNVLWFVQCSDQALSLIVFPRPLITLMVVDATQ